MKNIVQIFVFSILLSSAFHSLAQDINLKDLKTPNSPGFQILDIAPSNIQRPTNPKAFALGLFGLTNNGTAVPKNFAFEVSPFWYFRHEKTNVYTYLNIKNTDSTKQGAFVGIYNKLSVSMASSFSDSTAGSLLKNTNYISVGARTNLLTLRTKKQHIRLSTALSAISKKIQTINPNKNESDKLMSEAVTLKKAIREEPDIAKKDLLIEKLKEVENKIDHFNEQELNPFEKLIESDKEIQRNLTYLDELPIFQVDIAYAYSGAFEGNLYANKRFNRSGVWLTAALSGFGFDKDKMQDNVSLTAYMRYMKDNTLKDTIKNIFQKENSFDVGVKLEYSIRQFSLSVEYLKRSYSGNSSLNSERTVGLLQYKVNDNLYLVGTFGKNFGNYKNVFTLLGINWGFGKNPLQLP